MKYDEFLRVTAIMPEEEFHEIVDTLPEISINEFEESLRDDSYNMDSQYDLASVIINAILKRYTAYAYVDSLDLDSKYAHVDDIESIEELCNVRKAFLHTNWEIDSDDEEEIEKAKRIEAEESARNKCLKVINNLPTEKLKEIISKL